MTLTGLRCRNCGKRYPAEALSICEECFGPLEAEYDYEVIKDSISVEKIQKRAPTLWRYRELLPVSASSCIVDLHAGFTPLHRADNLAEELGIRELYIKNDSVNPTFSFKDRVVSVAVSKAIEFGFDTVGCASTGNLASSVAAHAAKARLKCYIFIPANLNLGKVVQTLAYSPRLVSVEGNYDDVNRLCTEIAGYYNWGFVNINLRPYYAEGSKTLGYEVVEQLGWEAPDRAVVPVASGSLLTKVYKGLKELEMLGMIEQADTRMTAAQSEGCSPVTTAFRTGSAIKPVKPKTIEKSLAIGNPADGSYALKIIRETDGTAGAASDEEIIEGIKLLARTEGIFTETAGGVVIATLKKLVEEGEIDRDERVVAYITGNGLKTQDVLHSYLQEPPVIKADLEEFRKLIEQKKEVVVW
ncbi:MAG: threonine synthase [Euryarchaeota archaeon]|nr:threonine synthase [Euryarchaeota archaeon]